MIDVILTDKSKCNCFDSSLRDEIFEYIEGLRKKKHKNLSDYKNFWPPRLMKALEKDKLVCFFGAGLSLPCGLPNWDSLLRDNLGVSKEFLDDDNAKNDPLTQAELASHKIGTEKVQILIRDSVKKTDKPSFNHYLLAFFKLKYYITSNYDYLFENAWKELHDESLIKILNDSDLYTYFDDGNIDSPKKEYKDGYFLFKIHGCANKDRNNEQLILTRSDYRRHYRSNEKFFTTLVREIFAKSHMLFLGFSHKDPEISRLVEDSIWYWEKNKEENKKNNCQPNFYSLQFDMTSVTPEIFAARGIVALSPDIQIPKDSTIDMRSYCLSRALADLHAMKNYIDIDKISLEKDIENYYREINDQLNSVFKMLKACESKSKKCLADKKDFSWLNKLREEMTCFAGQGVYLLDENGNIVTDKKKELAGYSIDEKLKETREEKLHTTYKSFGNRPYFQQARTFRKPFISDLYNSVFNGLATFSICFPIIDDNVFKGLLFSACQIGQWTTPVDSAEKIIKSENKRSVILVDSNGICLLPPNGEFDYETIDINVETKNGIKTEERKGFLLDDLLVLSRRDKLINRVMENLIPLGIDDDVLSLSTDLKYHSLVKEIPLTRWKLAISSRLISPRE